MRGVGGVRHGAVDGEAPLDREQVRHTLRRSVPFLRPYRWDIAIGLVAIVIYTASTAAGPLIVRVAINDGLTGHQDRTVIMWSAVAYVGATIVLGASERAQIILVNRVGESFLRDLRGRVFSHLMSLSMSFFDSEQTGRLVTRMTSDIDALEQLVQQGLLIFVTSVLLLFAIAAVLLVLSPLLFLVVLVVLPPVIIAGRKFRRDANASYLIVRDRISETFSSLQESLAGIRVTQAFGHESLRHEKFRSHNQAQLEANVDSTVVTARYFPVLEFTTTAATAAVIGVGGFMVHVHLTSIGTVTAFVLYLAYLINPIQQISQLFNLVQQSTAALAKLYGLLDTEAAVGERPGALDLPGAGDLVVTDLSFAYRAGAEPVLSGVHLVVRQGERLALVGPTGAGKSTLAKLMARLYDPTAGTVTYGGVDLRDATVASLRQRIAVVPQEGFLFHGTIRENIRMARPDASDLDVADAVRTIGAEAHFAGLAEGLDTAVRERGSRLSAGERQLVSLARAALANPEVLILDEATSNLDPGTEAEVERAMSALMAGRTVVMVAHRLSTAERADRVGVVDGGLLVEIGPHHELIGRPGRYATLHASWRRDGEGRSPAGVETVE